MSSGQYSDVFQKVELRISSRSFLLLIRNKTLPNARIGIIVAKKHVKLAVQRNRIKRLIRDSFRCEYQLLPAVDIVILAKKNTAGLNNSELTDELKYLWRKLKLKQSSLNQSNINIS